MRKLKAGIIDKLIKAKVTGAEIDFLLWLSHHQNEEGKVRGVYYKDVVADLYISYQTFYNVKKSLAEKRIIEVSKDSRFYDDWEIQILDNDFSGEELQPGRTTDSYLNTGLDIFYRREFYTMKANEKLMTMLYVKIAGAGSPNYHIGTAKFFEKYTKLLCVTKRTLQNYLTGIRRWFSIGIKDRTYWINPLRKKVYRENGRSDKSERAGQIAGSLCRRFRLEEAGKAYAAIKSLAEQYTYKVRIDLEPALMEALRDHLIHINGSILPRRWRRRRINEKYLHQLLLERLPEGAYA
ncbi:hypothetical protein V1224_09510 [Lachnospiraceae bacterium JLR.KK008]